MLLFSTVAAPEIETPERARAATWPKPRAAARHHDERREAATTPMETDPKSLVLCPYNDRGSPAAAAHHRFKRASSRRGRRRVQPLLDSSA